MQAQEFVEGFRELLLNSPRYNLKQVQAENCDYADTAVKSKNVYYSFGAFYCEDVFYARYSRRCTDCCDIAFCVGCTLCIRCSDCADCYSVSDCWNCCNCTESEFCRDCYSCDYCFGCVGLHRARYHIFNRPVTRQVYEDFRNTGRLQLTDEIILQRMEQLRRCVPLPAWHQFRTEDSIGSNLSECSACYQCYDSFALENCYYCIETNGNKSCCDLTVCFEAELCYGCIHSPLNYNCNFLVHTDRSADCDFCAYSRNLKSCFGCVYLSDKQYHILNRPVAPDLYPVIAERLRLELAECGMFDLSPYFNSAYEWSRYESEAEGAVQSIEEG